MEDLLGREKRLQIGDGEENARFVQGWQLLVEYSVEKGKSPFSFFQLLLGAGDFDLFPFLGSLQCLERVALTIVIHQLPATLFDFFLKAKQSVR